MARFHTTTLPVFDDEGNQIGFEQIDIPFTAEEEAEADAREEAHASEAQKSAIRQQIADLEAQVTPRRQREAILGVDGGWLATKDSEIAALRAQL